MRSTRTSQSRAPRVVLALALGAGLAAIAPAACLYPSYTFDAPEPTGSGGASASSATSTPDGSGDSTSPSSGGGQGGASTSTSTSTSSTGGSDAGTEDCTNGVDDNGDGKVDCADPACGAAACVSEVPSGWTGYIALYEGDPGKDPGCPAVTFPNQLYTGKAGLTAPPAQCSTCTCGAPVGITCTVPPLSVATATCAQIQTGSSFCSGDLNEAATGVCNGQDGFLGGQTNCGPPPTCKGNQACNGSITLPEAAVTGTGICTASAQSAKVSQASWSTLGRACGNMAIGGGCNVGQVCLPKPAAPYQGGICVFKKGLSTCPALFPTQHVFYDDLDDKRACSDCTCGTSSGGACQATVNIYKDGTVNTCNTLLTTITAGTCKDLTGNPTVGARKVTSVQVTNPGSCPPGGGQALGAATPTGPTTFCCK